MVDKINKLNIAQLNIARMKGKNIDDPVMKEFKDQLDAINLLAEKSEGFIWRLKDEANNATAFNPFNDERVIINMSVWRSAQHLKNYVYQSAHTVVMRDRKKWFEKFEQAYYVLWCVQPGHIPTIDEAIERLNHFQKHGASDYAFDFAKAEQFVAV
jgi:heme-degrading monooxygenase HmoA